MNLVDAGELAGWLFMAWGVGFGMGLLITAFRRFSESI